MPMKPPIVYALQLAAKFQVNPASKQMVYYKEMAELFHMMISDCDVAGVMNSAAPGSPVVVIPGPAPTGLKLL